MSRFTNTEYAQMIFCYGYCDGNSNAAREEYQRRYPDQRVPNRRTIAAAYQRLQETGHVQIRNREHTSSSESADLEERVMRIFRTNPGTSIRLVANRLMVSTYTVWSILKAERQHPYHYSGAQDILPADEPRRIAFSQWIIENNLNDGNFLKNILWTDECHFSREGVVNFHNTHIWSSQNPKKVRRKSYQTRFSVNLWAGVLGNELVGPFRIPPRLNSANYLEFLRTEIEDFLDNLSLTNLADIIYQHDGAPAHCGRRVRAWLDMNFSNKYISRNGPINWPPRSPDLTPLDFYVWGRMKEVVYFSDVNSLDELNRRIDIAADQIRIELRTMDIARNIAKRAYACVTANGGHFEQLL